MRNLVASLALLVAVVPGMAPAAAPDDPPPAPAAAAAPPAADTGPRTEGVIPGLLFGPKVSTTMLFPPNVMVGFELKVIGYVGASFEYGVYPRSLAVDKYELQMTTWSAGLRAYPFRGAFFVGLVLGKYDITATQQASTPGGQPSTLNVSSLYLGPQIGWKWAFDFGLFLGLNLGYGFSLDYQSTLVEPIPPPNTDLQTLKENADKYLKTGVPIFTLLELGWLF